MTALSTLQDLPMIGAIIAGIFAFGYSFWNGWKEKQEGKREGREQADREWRTREEETRRQLKGQEDETRQTTANVDRHFEDIRHRRGRVADDDRDSLPDIDAEVGDWNFRGN